MNVRFVAIDTPWAVSRLQKISTWWGIPFGWDIHLASEPIACQEWGTWAVLAEAQVDRWRGTLLNPEPDFTLIAVPLQMPAKDAAGNVVANVSNVGLMRGWDSVLEVFANEQDHSSVDGIDLGDTFTLYANHEISHYLYLKLGLPDKTHLYFYAGAPEKARDELLAKLKTTMPKQNINPNSDELYDDWSVPAQARHNVRALCDLAGLSYTPTENVDGKMYSQKDILTACIARESGFDNAVKPCENKGLDGVVWSRDWGIVQVNDWYHIGTDKDFPSVEYVLANPTIMVNWMIRCMKEGKLSMWSSYSTGAYKRYL